MKSHTYIIGIFLLLISCNSKDDQLAYFEKYRNQVIKKDYYENGQVKILKYFAEDTINGRGPEVHFMSDGKLEKWMWFDYSISMESGYNRAVGGIVWDSTLSTYKNLAGFHF